jgi:glycosyltransferase involved in cell wall biosynthesis
VPQGNPTALADKVLSLLNDPYQAAIFVASGRKRMQHEFTRAKMLSSLQNIYQAVLDEKNIGKVTS